MQEANKALMHRWFEEVWNKRRFELMEEIFTPNVVCHGLVNEKGERVTGFSDFAALYHQFIAAFPDIHFSVEDVIAERDKVVARCRVTGTHEGEGLGLKASGLSIDIEGITIARIEDGRIAEGWNHYDFIALYKQIGVL